MIVGPAIIDFSKTISAKQRRSTRESLPISVNSYAKHLKYLYKVALKKSSGDSEINKVNKHPMPEMYFPELEKILLLLFI